MKILFSVIFVLTLCASAARAQISDAEKLSGVRRIYIDNLGGEKNSAAVRAKIRAKLAKSSRFVVVENRDAADAVLTGIAGVEGFKRERSFVNPMSGEVLGDPGTSYKSVGLLRLLDKNQKSFWMFSYKRSFSLKQSAVETLADKLVRQLLDDAGQAEAEKSKN